MKRALNEDGLKILEYLKGLNGKNVTVEDIAAEFGIPANSMGAKITSSLQRKGYTVRVEAQIEGEDGLYKNVKFVQLTDEGKAYDHEAALKADMADALAKK